MASRQHALAAAAVFAALLPVAASAVEETRTFPTVAADDLNGTRVTVPGGLQGTYRLVLVGYDRAQQKTMDVWIKQAVALKQPESTLGIYEIPIVEDPGMIGRSMINTGMKLAVRDRKTRSRIITLYTDKVKMMQQIGVQDDQTIDALLLNAAGQIVWSESGPATAAKLQSLQKFINAGDAAN